MTSGKTILITGCSSGIGAHCARVMKARGWRVLATARKTEDLKTLKTHLEQEIKVVFSEHIEHY